MLEVRGLKKTYPGFALNCSLDVKKGNITGIVGENGAGKSTLFKTILKLVYAEQGTIKLFGKDLNEIEEKDFEKIGTVLADTGFNNYLTVRDTQKILRQFYPAFDEERFMSGCRKFNLDPAKKIIELSTGMKAKLKVLTAITHQADFLILDEPTTGLDVMARDEVLEMLRDYMAEKEDRAILISSHISSDLESLCDDIYMIHKGNIILHEDADTLMDSYGILKVSVSEYEKLDKQYLLKRKKESFGYSCLTNQIRYYQENYPETVVEKTHIDDVIIFMAKGESV